VALEIVCNTAIIGGDVYKVTHQPPNLQSATHQHGQIPVYCVSPTLDYLQRRSVGHVIAKTMPKSEKSIRLD
jgi:hypothetical protein